TCLSSRCRRECAPTRRQLSNPKASNLIVNEAPHPEADPLPVADTATATESSALLYTERLVKAYRARRVVNTVSINVAAGEIVGLLGPNGAGKTTTFNIVVGVVKPDAGEVRFLDRDITRLPMHKRAR